MTYKQGVTRKNDEPCRFCGQENPRTNSKYCAYPCWEKGKKVIERRYFEKHRRKHKNKGGYNLVPQNNI